VSVLPTTPRRRAPRRTPLLRWGLWAAVIVVVFGLGVAVGLALEERPQTGEPVTQIRTIQPWTQTQR
jgi:hypothetical protein